MNNNLLSSNSPYLYFIQYWNVSTQSRTCSSLTRLYQLITWGYSWKTLYFSSVIYKINIWFSSWAQPIKVILIYLQLITMVLNIGSVFWNLGIHFSLYFIYNFVIPVSIWSFVPDQFILLEHWNLKPITIIYAKHVIYI